MLLKSITTAKFQCIYLDYNQKDFMMQDKGKPNRELGTDGIPNRIKYTPPDSKIDASTYIHRATQT